MGSRSVQGFNRKNVLDNKLNIDGVHLSFPVRIKKVLEIEDVIIVSLSYDYILDVGLEWNKGGKEKWHDINANFKNPTLFCFDKFGNKIWEFALTGFVDISKLDNQSVENDLRLKLWIQNNPDKPNVFIVYSDDKLIVDFKTGEIYQRLETR